MAYNFAQKRDGDRIIIEQKQSRSNCIFISHKKEDEDAAIKIGDYLLNEVGVNIYLDVYDCKLQEAVSLENDKEIVNSIKRGMELSTHLLCLVSDKTKLSWWVPYEIGIADVTQKNIASLKLARVDDIPSFLKIQENLYTISDFLKYASKIMPLGLYFETMNYDKLQKSYTRELEKYVDIERR